MIDDDALDSRLRAADRARSVPKSPDSLGDLLHEVTQRKPIRTRHLKLVTTLGVGALIAIGAGVLPAAAAIQSFIAQIVDNPPGEGSEVIPDEGWLDTNASDIEMFVASRYPEELPLPGGVAPEDVMHTVAFSISQMGGVTQEIAVDQAYESYVYCRWVDVWLTTDDSGDIDGRNFAAGVMSDAASWPAVVATDGGGVVDQLNSFADAAAEGERDQDESAFQFNACPDWKAMGLSQ